MMTSGRNCARAVATGARLPLQAARAKFVNRVEGWRLTTVVQTHAQHLVPAQCELAG